MKGRSDIRGYTLVELLVVMAISTILIGILVGLIISGNRQYLRIQKEADIFSDIQMVRKAITNELKNDINKTYWLLVPELEKYHTLQFGESVGDRISFDNNTLTIKSRQFNYGHINDIYFSKYKESELLMITIAYGEDLTYNIFFSCLKINE